MFSHHAYREFYLANQLISIFVTIIYMQALFKPQTLPVFPHGFHLKHCTHTQSFTLLYPSIHEINV